MISDTFKRIRSAKITILTLIIFTFTFTVIHASQFSSSNNEVPDTESDTATRLFSVDLDQNSGFPVDGDVNHITTTVNPLLPDMLNHFNHHAGNTHLVADRVHIDYARTCITFLVGIMFMLCSIFFAIFILNYLNLIAI